METYGMKTKKFNQKHLPIWVFYIVNNYIFLISEGLKKDWIVSLVTLTK